MSKPKPEPAPPPDDLEAGFAAPVLQVTTQCDTGLTVGHIRDFNHRVYLHGLSADTPVFALTSLNLGGRVTQLTCRDEGDGGE